MSGPDDARVFALAEKYGGVAGCDLSAANGSPDWRPIDWTVVAAFGRLKFFWCKASEDLTYRDSAFAHNMRGARGVGIAGGAYHFFHPLSNARAQASNFLGAYSRVGGRWPTDLGPLHDVEWMLDDGSVPVEPGTYRRRLITYIDIVEQALQVLSWVYVGGSYFREHLFPGISNAEMEFFRARLLVLPAYVTDPPDKHVAPPWVGKNRRGLDGRPLPDWDDWQCNGDRGVGPGPYLVDVPGISSSAEKSQGGGGGAVDADVYAGTLTELYQTRLMSPGPRAAPWMIDDGGAKTSGEARASSGASGSGMGAGTLAFGLGILGLGLLAFRR